MNTGRKEALIGAGSVGREIQAWSYIILDTDGWIGDGGLGCTSTTDGELWGDPPQQKPCSAFSAPMTEGIHEVMCAAGDRVKG